MTPIFNEMSNNNTCSNMPMYFNLDYIIPNILFDFWQVPSAGIYAASLAVLFFLAILNQFFAMLARRKMVQKRVAIEDEKQQQAYNTRQKLKRILMYMFKPICFLLNTTLSYMLMLAVMSFNLGIFLVVIVGSSIGWTLFSMPLQVQTECH